MVRDDSLEGSEMKLYTLRLRRNGGRQQRPALSITSPRFTISCLPSDHYPKTAGCWPEAEYGPFHVSIALRPLQPSTNARKISQGKIPHENGLQASA